MNSSSTYAMSPEMRFIAKNSIIAWDIRYENVDVPPTDRDLLETVYRLADQDAKNLLGQLKSALEEGVHGCLRLGSWHQRRGMWRTWSDIYLGIRGPKKSVGWTGFEIEEFRVIGYMRPRRGGLDGRRDFGSKCREKMEHGSKCREKMEHVHLTGDYPQRYPTWLDDFIIWFDKELKPRQPIKDLQSEITKQARRFFRIAEPLLRGGLGSC